MASQLVQVVDPKVIVVDPFVVVPAFEGEQEVVFLYKLERLTRNLGFLLIRGPDIMLWKTVDRFVIQRIGAAKEVFPFLIAETIGRVRFRIIPGAEMGGRPAAKTKPEAFDRVKAIEGTGRTDFNGPRLFIASEQKGSPVDKPPEGFHPF